MVGLLAFLNRALEVDVEDALETWGAIRSASTKAGSPFILPRALIETSEGAGRHLAFAGAALDFKRQRLASLEVIDGNGTPGRKDQSQDYPYTTHQKRP